MQETNIAPFEKYLETLQVMGATKEGRLANSRLAFVFIMADRRETEFATIAGRFFSCSNRSFYVLFERILEVALDSSGSLEQNTAPLSFIEPKSSHSGTQLRAEYVDLDTCSIEASFSLLKKSEGDKKRILNRLAKPENKQAIVPYLEVLVVLYSNPDLTCENNKASLYATLRNSLAHCPWLLGGIVRTMTILENESKFQLMRSACELDCHRNHFFSLARESLKHFCSVAYDSLRPSCLDGIDLTDLVSKKADKTIQRPFTRFYSSCSEFILLVKYTEGLLKLVQDPSMKLGHGLSGDMREDLIHFTRDLVTELNSIICCHELNPEYRILAVKLMAFVSQVGELAGLNLLKIASSPSLEEFIKIYACQHIAEAPVSAALLGRKEEASEYLNLAHNCLIGLLVKSEGLLASTAGEALEKLHQSAGSLILDPLIASLTCGDIDVIAKAIEGLRVQREGLAEKGLYPYQFSRFHLAPSAKLLLEALQAAHAKVFSRYLLHEEYSDLCDQILTELRACVDHLRNPKPESLVFNISAVLLADSTTDNEIRAFHVGRGAYGVVDPDRKLLLPSVQPALVFDP